MKGFIPAGALAMGVMVTLGACGPHQPWVTTSSESSHAQWIGHNRVELVHQMGQPKETVPKTEGGEMLYYPWEGHQYVFETDRQGNIISAMQSK